MAELAEDFLRRYPAQLRRGLCRIAPLCKGQLYVTGGAVRDWLMGRTPADLDFSLAGNSFHAARLFLEGLTGTVVPLDMEEGVIRVAWQDYLLDFCTFRDGVQTMAADLALRDYTINALAVAVDPAGGGLLPPFTVIDPTGGRADIANGRVRLTAPAALAADPCRILRGYRLQAVLGFTLAASSRAQFGRFAPRLAAVAWERINQELDKLFTTPRAYPALAAMVEDGVLPILFPELTAMVDCQQPASHHLDVFGHSLEACRWMEALLNSPASWFPVHQEEITAWLAENDHRRRGLMWAALFHDLGKPARRKLRQGRITFYQHDGAGAEMFAAMARKRHWRNRDISFIRQCIALHMRPFHLNNERRQGRLTTRACLRLLRAAGDNVIGLFLLAMADSLAGSGPEKPPAMEASLADLFGELMDLYHTRLAPVMARPPLLNGHQVMAAVAQPPGPLIGRLLEALLEAQLEGRVRTAEEAVTFVRREAARNADLPA